MSAVYIIILDFAPSAIYLASMASPSPAQNRAMKDQLQARLPNNGSKKDNRPLLGVSTNLQVQGSPVSPKCSDRASSEHSKVPSDLNEDPISPLYSDQDGPRPSSAVQMAAWDRKFILTLGKREKSDWTVSCAHGRLQMAEGSEATPHC